MLKFCGRDSGIASASDVWEWSDKSGSENIGLIEKCCSLKAGQYGHSKLLVTVGKSGLCPWFWATEVGHLLHV